MGQDNDYSAMKNEELGMSGRRKEQQGTDAQQGRGSRPKYGLPISEPCSITACDQDSRYTDK